MAQISPLLQFLLQRRRGLAGGDSTDQSNTDIEAAPVNVGQGPTIALRRRPNLDARERIDPSVVAPMNAALTGGQGNDFGPSRDTGIGAKLRNLRLPFPVPMIPGVFNDGAVEDAKRNIQFAPRDGMYPPRDPNAPPIDPGMTPPPSPFPMPGGLSQGVDAGPTIPLRNLAHYRGTDQPSDGDPRVMAKPTGNGKYAERVIGSQGQSVGYGDQRDYAPLAQEPTIPLTRQRPAPVGFDPTRQARPDNPLPGSIYDPAGKFVGYEPTSSGFPSPAADPESSPDFQEPDRKSYTDEGGNYVPGTGLYTDAPYMPTEQKLKAGEAMRGVPIERAKYNQGRPRGRWANQTPNIAPAATVDPTISLHPRRALLEATPAATVDPTIALGARAPVTTAGKDTSFTSSLPRDVIAEDRQRLLDAQNKPRNRKKEIAEGIGQYFGSMVGLNLKGILHPRGSAEQQAQRQLNTDLGIEKEQAVTANQRATAYDRMNRAPAMSTRVVREGEFEGVPGGTKIRQTWNPQTRRMIDALDLDGQPVIADEPKEESGAFKTNENNEVVFAPRNGPARPVFDLKGNPLKEKVTARGGGNVQTNHRLADDGITVIQTQRDPESNQWVDSVGPNGKPIVMGQVGKIDPATGAPVTSILTDNRVTNRERQENKRKRQSYESEAKEWGGKETSFRQNKAAEDEAIRTKTAQLQALYTEKPSAYGGLTGGTRSQQEIDTEKAKLLKEIEVHRANVTHFQQEADKAAGSATTARRNAGLYADSGQSVVGRPPASDGKHHYTIAEIQAQASQAGTSYDALYNKLKADKRVVIDK